MEYIKPRVFATSVEFNSGQALELQHDDIVVFVGANNVGKSATLQQIVQRASHPRTRAQHPMQGSNYRTQVLPHEIVKKVVVENEGALDDYRKWVNERFDLVPRNPGSSGPPQYRCGEISLSGEFYHGTRWENLAPDKHGNIPYINIFWKQLNVMNRLNANSRPNQMGFETPSNLVQKLYESLKEEKEFSKLFRETFGTDIVINRFGGGSIPIHVGDRPEPQEGEEYFSVSFARRFRKLALLEHQGNGMKAFFGLLNRAVGDANRSALFIDEPEIFLHPPHARKLGRFLAEQTASNRQLFLATHNGAFIRGILDAASSRVRIVRIGREGKFNPIHQLDKDDIEKLWGDNVLKHTNILDGLFHERVVVCEGDSDCRFFAAMNNTVSPDRESLFVAAGGKGRIGSVVRSLTNIGVNVNAVVDFDVLNQESSLRGIFEALGGDWSEIESSYRLVKLEVEKKKPELEKSKVLDEIKKAFAEIGAAENSVPKSTVSQIRDVLKRSSPWLHCKSIGHRIIPSGDAYGAWKKINDSCRDVGLQIVEDGELESFAPELGGDKQKWVTKALALDLATDSSLANARQFVLRLFAARQPESE